MKRNNFLIVWLMAQAAISAAAGSSALSSLVNDQVVAAVSLFNGMMAASTAVYVTWTKPPTAAESATEPRSPAHPG